MTHTWHKLEEGKLTIGFIGGSITDARTRYNWPEPVIAWLVESFPLARIVVENAAIGATGSELAVFRAKRDLIDRGCDLVFIDFSVISDLFGWDSKHWAEAEILQLDEVSTEGPWTLHRWPFYEWIDRVLETSVVGAKLSLTFEGRGLSFGFDFGKTSAEFRYRIDGGEWFTKSRERPDWCGDDGWYRTHQFTLHSNF